MKDTFEFLQPSGAGGNAHEIALQATDQYQHVDDAASINTIVERIVSLNKGIADFWSGAKGWAYLEAAELLARSRLDRHVSLCKCLRIWVSGNTATSDGSLILAWANMGTLVEGLMKLFLSPWYKGHESEVIATVRGEQVKNPDSLSIEPLKSFFRENLWDDQCFDKWVSHVQQRRNALHAFKEREIGTFDEFENDLRIFLRFTRYINERLPYPDDDYVPRTH